MGTPHIFFDDFTAASGVTRMRMSTLKNGTWQVTTTPVASFFYNGLNNLNWDFGTWARSRRAAESSATIFLLVILLCAL
jgi:hypothetical protein